MWAAVAPELEPYLNAQPWPSGLPLPVGLRTHAARRLRPPPWLPHWHFAAWVLFYGMLFYSKCLSVVLWASAAADSSEGPDTWTCTHSAGVSSNGDYACWVCNAMTVCGTLLLSLLVYGVFRVKNEQVQQHVNCLYALYTLDRADPSAPHELVCDFGTWNTHRLWDDVCPHVRRRHIRHRRQIWYSVSAHSAATSAAVVPVYHCRSLGAPSGHAQLRHQLQKTVVLGELAALLLRCVRTLGVEREVRDVYDCESRTALFTYGRCKQTAALREQLRDDELGAGSSASPRPPWFSSWSRPPVQQTHDTMLHIP